MNLFKGLFGNSPGALTNDDIKKLTTETDIKKGDIKKIHKKFVALDKEKKGYVTINDLVEIPEIEANPLRFHIGQYLSNGNKNDIIGFEKFLKLIDIFMNKKTDDQTKFMFDLFDFDKDGKISSEDMLVNFKLLLGNTMPEDQIKEIVEKTIIEYSTDQKFITREDFDKILNEAQ
jgi:Ca2+-binding EF-hand superfamily protein